MCLHHHLFYLHSIIFVVVLWCRASNLPLFSSCNKRKCYPATHKHTKTFRTHLICVRKQWWHCLFSQRYGAPGCSPAVWISYSFKKQAMIHSFVCNKISEGLIFCSMWQRKKKIRKEMEMMCQDVSKGRRQPLEGKCFSSFKVEHSEGKDIFLTWGSFSFISFACMLSHL